MKNLLIIFAKAPEPGRVKTRLIPCLSPETAASLQKAFLLDILNMSRDVQGERLIACAPDIRHPFFQHCEREDSIRLIPQTGKDLGARMEQAFCWAFSEGFERVVVMGCDSPTLPLAYIEEAFESLVLHSVVLGPSLDGGYYLLGAKATPSILFKQMDWGTEVVLNETLQRLNDAQQSYHLLPFWYDIDLPADLVFLKQHLKYLEMKGTAELEATRKKLAEIDPFIQQ